MKKYGELESLILDNAEDNGLLEVGNLVGQYNRLRNSVERLQKATITKSNGFKEYIDSFNNKVSKVEESIPSSLGKILYELIVLAEINGVSLEDCLTETFKNKK